MYTYSGARVKSLGSRGRWFAQDVKDLTMSELITRYVEVCLILTHPDYPNPLGLYLQGINSQFNLVHDTSKVPAWLTKLNTTSLPVSEEFPSLDVIYATYMDAFQANYDVTPVAPILNPMLTSVAITDKRDLRLTKKDMDYAKLFNSILVTVNGFFHRTNYVGDAVHVLEGGHSSRYSNRYHIGLYAIGNLGKVTTAPICDRLIHAEAPDQPLKDRIVLEVDPRVGSIENKSVLLSIGGFLHLPDDKLIRRSGDRTYTVSITDFPLMARFFILKEYIDVSRITKHLSKGTNPNQISVEELYSDLALRALFTLSQSFFVIVDTPEIWLEKSLVEWNHLPGSYIAYEKPEYPLVDNLGKFNEYWAIRERDRYVLSTNSSYKPNYLFETTEWKEQTSVDNSRVPSQLTSTSEAFFFKLGKNL